MINFLTEYSFLITGFAFGFVWRGQIIQIQYIFTRKSVNDIAISELNGRIIGQLLFIISILIRTPDIILICCASISLILVIITRYLVKKYNK